MEFSFNPQEAPRINQSCVDLFCHAGNKYGLFSLCCNASFFANKYSFNLLWQSIYICMGTFSTLRLQQLMKLFNNSLRFPRNHHKHEEDFAISIFH